jgi:hypothetical protein
MSKKVPDQRSEVVPSVTLEGIKGALRHLCDINHKIVEFLQSEYKRKMTLQNYIGEAVLYELLCQSYGVPEYTTEESHKRLLSVIMGAMKNHQNRPTCSLDTVDSLVDLWNRPDDPHSLETVTPDIDTIRLRKIVTDILTIKEAAQQEKPLNITKFNGDPCKLGLKTVPEKPDLLTQLWEQPTEKSMNIMKEAFEEGGANYTPKKPEPVVFKTYDVQINGKLMGSFKSDPISVPDKSLQQNALNIALPIIKKRRRKIKKVIRSGTTWNFVV